MELGIALTVIAAVAWGAGDVFARKAMFETSAAMVLTSMIVLIVITLGVVGIGLEGLSAFGSKDLEFFGLVALMGLLTWVTGHLLYFHGMQRAGVIIAAPILGAAPLPAIAIAVAFGGERPNAWIIVGAIAIVTGVALLVTQRDRIIS